MKSYKKLIKCKSCKKVFKKRTWDKRDKNKFCSSRCALVPCRTKKHQRRAGKRGALVNIAKYRGTGTGYIKELTKHQHRVVMERMIKRALRRGEIVHHKDGDRHNNLPSNLELMTQSEHARLHLKTMKRNKLGHLLKQKKWKRTNIKNK